MHRRKAIRDAVVAALVASPQVLALAPVPAVESSRVVPMDPAKLPRILVYLRGEKVDGLLTRAPREYRVTSELVVEYVDRMRVNQGPSEDALDAAAEALEATLDRLETENLGDLVRQCTYQGTDVAVEIRGELLTCHLQMRYELELGRVVAPQLVDNFITAAINYDAGAAPNDNPSDVVTLPIV